MKRFIAICICILMTFLLAACGDIVSNSIDAEYLSIAEVNGETYIKSKFSYVYRLDLENKTFTRVPTDSFGKALDWSNVEFLKYELFAGEYVSTIPEGYDKALTHIEDCKIDDEKSVIYAYGHIYDNALIGFVQVYKEASGDCGGYAIENISHSLLFEYNLDVDEFRILDKIDDAVAVAIHNNTAIYWKDKVFYQYDILNKAKMQLTEDKAYDSGIQQQSWAAVLSNFEYCVIHFNKVCGSQETEYMFIYDFSKGTFYELSFME